MNYRRISKRSKNKNFSDINVTPLVDVMLVLLVVFMVTSPMMVTGVNVDLPKADASTLEGNDEPLVISVNHFGDVFLNETKIEKNELSKKLKFITQQKMDTRIFVRGDKKADYGKIMTIVGLINASGFSKVSLVTDSNEN